MQIAASDIRCHAGRPLRRVPAKPARAPERLLRIFLAIALCTAAGCAVDPNAAGGGQLLQLDFNDFACKVQRPMVRRCSMLACHGQQDHALRIYSPGKLRRGTWASLNEREGHITLEEIQANYASARGLTFGAASVDEVPLIRKVISPDLGGGEHVGGVIFRSMADPDLVLLRNWVSGEKSDPCPLSMPATGG